MTARRHWIGELLLRVQDAFLEQPGLELTSSAAERRFGADEVACEAVLNALADANVLARTRGGAFVRRPRPAAWRRRRAGAARGRAGVRPSSVHAA